MSILSMKSEIAIENIKLLIVNYHLLSNSDTGEIIYLSHDDGSSLVVDTHYGLCDYTMELLEDEVRHIIIKDWLSKTIYRSDSKFDDSDSLLNHAYFIDGKYEYNSGDNLFKNPKRLEFLKFLLERLNE